ncbi:hypothetical protein ES706_00031 [subsurface metagenome]
MQEMATEVVEKFPDWRNEIESIKENVQKLGFTPDLESPRLTSISEMFTILKENMIWQLNTITKL